MENKLNKAIPILKSLNFVYEPATDKLFKLNDDNNKVVEYNSSTINPDYGYTFTNNSFRYENELESIIIEFNSKGNQLEFYKIRIFDKKTSKDLKKQFEKIKFTCTRLNEKSIKIIDNENNYEAEFDSDFISLLDKNIGYIMGYYYSSLINPDCSNIDTLEQQTGFIELFKRISIDHENLMSYVMSEIEEINFNYAYISNLEFEEKKRGK